MRHAVEKYLTHRAFLVFFIFSYHFEVGIFFGDLLLFYFVEILTIRLSHDGTTHEIHFICRECAGLVTKYVLDLQVRVKGGKNMRRP